MKTVNATQMKHRLGTVLSQARQEPVTVTMHGKPSHVLLNYDEYQSLKRPAGARYFHEIDDPEERAQAVDGWIDGLRARAVPVDPGVITREELY